MPMTDSLEAGDFLPDFQLVNQRGKLTLLSRKMLGKAGIVVFYPDHDKPACQALLRSFTERSARFQEVAHLFAVTAEGPEDNAAKAQRLELPFDFILSDPGAQIAEGLGVGHNGKGQSDFAGSGAFTVFVTDTNRRLLRIDRDIADPGYAEELLAFLEGRPERETRVMGPMAPVLYVPAVFTPAYCGKLIEIYHTRGNEETGAQVDDTTGQPTKLVDHSIKVRRDHKVSDPALISEIRGLIGKRVIPEIQKAFHYRVTHHEYFKLACYDGADSGFFAPHRDDSNASSAHRRFAMTLNLNAEDYEGGALRFPEYGPELYAPATGAAVVFSCSLLHEARPVTKGRRYALLAFFYGDESKGILERPAVQA